MAIVFYLFILICAIAFPRSNKVAALSVAFMFVMYSFAYYEGDLQIYQWIYESGMIDTTFEPGFNALIFLCRALGLGFTGFRMVLAFIFLLLLYTGVSKYTEYKALAISLMIIFPFFVFTSVLRSGIACVILLNSYVYIIDPAYGKKGTAKYVAIVLLATLFHYSSALMLIFVFGKIKITPKMIIAIIAFTTSVYVLLNFTDLAYQLLSHFTSREKTLQWVSQGEGTANITGAIVILILISMNYYMARRSKDILNSLQAEGIVDFEAYEAEYSYNAAVLLFGFVPLMFLASPFLRVAYMLIPLIVSNTINAAYGYKTNCESRGFIPLLSVFLLCSLIIWRMHYELPYYSAGHIFFEEMIRTQFALYF